MHPSGLSPSASVSNMSHTVEREEREYVFGHRQLAAIAFVMVGLMGVAAAMAYMVGRAASPASAMLGREGAAVKKPIVIEVPVEKPSPSAASPDPVPVAARPANQPVTSASNPAPPKETNPPSPSPALVPQAAQPTAVAIPVAGSHYFQVVSTDRAQAEAVMAKLAAAGVSGLIGEGPSPDRVRVFAGPVNDAAMQLEIRQKIEALGFRPFLKKF